MRGMRAREKPLAPRVVLCQLKVRCGLIICLVTVGMIISLSLFSD